MDINNQRGQSTGKLLVLKATLMAKPLPERATSQDTGLRKKEELLA
jgi:hypothetical protein